MAEIVNLRQARKAMLKRKAVATADANRAIHGRTKAQRLLEHAERARQEALLDGAAIDHQPPER